jgi:hypothetical protein
MIYAYLLIIKINLTKEIFGKKYIYFLERNRMLEIKYL